MEQHVHLRSFEVHIVSGVAIPQSTSLDITSLGSLSPRPIINPKWYVISPSLLPIPRCCFQSFSTWVPPRYAKTSVLTNQLIRGPAFELEVWWVSRLGHRSSYVVSVEENFLKKTKNKSSDSRKCISSWSCLRAFFCLAIPHRSRTRGTLCLWQMLWHGFEPLS